MSNTAGGEPIKVLYISGVDVPTSVPLEVAAKIQDRTEALESIDVTVAAFRESSTQSDRRGRPVLPLGARSAYDIRAVWNLYRNLRTLQPDVIHIHHTASGLWGAALAKAFISAAVVRSEHSNQRQYSVLQSIAHWCSQILSDRVLCNSRNTYQNLYSIQKWTLGNEWSVVHNGVDVQRIKNAENKSYSIGIRSSDDRTLIGSVGRLVDAKNYQRLIRGFSSVLERIPKSHLVLIGDGENREELEQEAIARGIEDQVTFMGELSRDEVYSALHHFDVFVMPSLWEGFCNAVVEAMAAGLPILCSDISTLREVVGDTALYADPEDPSDMARAMIELLRMDASTRKQLGEKARERATERFAIDRTAEKYVEAYLEVTAAGVS